MCGVSAVLQVVDWLTAVLWPSLASHMSNGLASALQSVLSRCRLLSMSRAFKSVQYLFIADFLKRLIGQKSCDQL